jgi:hypothetical protein
MAPYIQRRNILSDVVPFVGGLVLSLVIGWIVFPMLLYVEKPQPMNFSHMKHGDQVGLECSDCHFFRSDGTFSGIPGTSNCAQCHEYRQSESPQEVVLMDEYIGGDREIPWQVYSRQPICVYFSHAPHVKMAEIECMTCHGPKETENILPAYLENRLTGYSIDVWGRNISGFKCNSWDRMKMDDCADCHSKRSAPNTCFVCHK